MNKQVLIIGAGLSGLSCARHLPHNLEYAIYEKENSVGGLCRTEQQDGFLFDYTGHLLHLKQPRLLKLVKELLPNNLARISRNSWIFSHQVFTRYPFQANTYGLPARIVKECVLGFIEAQIKKGQGRQENFYDWVIRNFGLGIGKHFMFGYNEKLWTLPVRQLGTEWLHSYVPRPTLAEVVNGALLDRTKRVGYNAYFWYPLEGGIQSLPDGLARGLERVNLREKAEHISLRDKKVRFSSGLTIEYTRLVSTISLVELIRMIEDAPSAIRAAAAKLRYNQVLNINLGVRPALNSDKHWIYFPEKKYPFYRVGYSSNFTPYNHPANTSSLYIEIAYHSDKLNLQDRKAVHRIVNQCVAKLRQIEILKRTSRIITVNILTLAPAYCIYDHNRNKSVRIIREYLTKQGVHSIGRYGAWEYSAMGNALEWGAQTALKLKEELC